MRRFNVTGLCVPHKHYMVDISGKLAQIKEMMTGETTLQSTVQDSMARRLRCTNLKNC